MSTWTLDCGIKWLVALKYGLLCRTINIASIFVLQSFWKSKLTDLRNLVKGFNVLNCTFQIYHSRGRPCLLTARFSNYLKLQWQSQILEKITFMINCYVYNCCSISTTMITIWALHNQAFTAITPSHGHMITILHASQSASNKQSVKLQLVVITSHRDKSVPLMTTWLSNRVATPNCGY